MLRAVFTNRDSIQVERCADPLDEQIARQYRAMSAQDLDRCRQKLRDTERAIEKITARTYGLCDDCDDPIPSKRLEAKKEAIRCVSCQHIHDLLP